MMSTSRKVTRDLCQAGTCKACRNRGGKQEGMMEEAGKEGLQHRGRGRELSVAALNKDFHH